MGDLKSLKLAAALVVVSLVAGLIHPDTRAGLLAGWRPSVEEAIKSTPGEKLPPAAFVTHTYTSLKPVPDKKLIQWPESAVWAAMETDDIVLKGIAARVSSRAPFDNDGKVLDRSKELRVWIKIREELLEQGTQLDEDNAFWWLERAASAAILGEKQQAEKYVLRASDCSSYNDFSWSEAEVRRALTQELVGFPTFYEDVSGATGTNFPHLSAQRNTIKSLLVGRPLAETAELRIGLARLGLVMSDDSPTLIGQLVGFAIHRLCLVKTAPGDTEIATRPEYYSTAEFETALSRLGLEADGAWRVLDPEAKPLVPSLDQGTPSPLVLFGPTMGYATTWRALLCGLLMAAGLWWTRKWAESGWLGLLRPAFAVAPLFAYLLTLTGRSGGKGVPETIIALCLVSAGCLIYKRAHILFPLIALALPQIIIQSGPARIEYILVGIFGSLLAIGGYLLAWKPELKASKWMAPWFPLILLALTIFAEMKVSGYVSFQPTNVYGEWPIKTMSEPTFTPVLFWSLGFTVLATLACLQKDRVAALAQAKSVATFTAILVASSVVYTGVMEAQSRDAIRQFTSETRYLEAQLREALRKADYPSPAAHNPAWKR